MERDHYSDHNYVLEYADKLISGEIVSSKRLKAVYSRLAEEIRGLDNSNTVDQSGSESKYSPSQWTFDNDKANRPIEFIERFCKHSKGEWAGKPIQLELFQKAFISALFGFVDRTTGLRRYREALFYVARKNGKSTMLSGLALYMMTADHEPGAEVYSVATKKDQAAIVFSECCSMVSQSPLIRQNVKKRKSDLFFSSNRSSFKPLGKNADTLDGLNAHLVIMDELHGIKDRNLYEVMLQSQSARRQPLLVMITTAGTVRECIFDDIYSYACSVADGTVKDDSFLPIMYELDSTKEWSDPSCWIKANPGLGTIKKQDDIIRKVKRAKNSRKELSGLLVKDFNIIGTATGSWLTYDELNNTETFNIEDMRGCYAVGGADLSKTNDLTCASLLIFGKDGKKYCHQMYWIPEGRLQDRLNEKIPYDRWIDQGFVRLCKGDSIQYSDVTAWFKEIHEQYDIAPLWIYYDPYSANYWTEEMTAAGFSMVKCHQGTRTLSVPMQGLESELRTKQINYNNNPVLKWCIGNTGIKTDTNGNIQPVKNLAAKMRIDGLAAMLDSYVGYCDHMQELLDLQEESKGY